MDGIPEMFDDCETWATRRTALRRRGAPGRRRTLLVPRTLFDRPAVFTPAQMREMDRATIEDIGVPGPVLMERAALGVSALVRSRFPGRHTLIVCGRGNNGGDGLAAARQLHLAGHPVACIVAAASPAELSPDAALNYAAAEKAGVNLRIGAVPDYLWDETELVVDCLLGTGATGELKGRVAEWAARINAAGARGVPVIAVDVPSGVDASTGTHGGGTRGGRRHRHLPRAPRPGWCARRARRPPARSWCGTSASPASSNPSPTSGW